MQVEVQETGLLILTAVARQTETKQADNHGCSSKATARVKRRRSNISVSTKSKLCNKKRRCSFYEVVYDTKLYHPSPHHELTLPRSLITHHECSAEFYNVASIWALKARESDGRLTTSDPVEVLLESASRLFAHLLDVGASDSTSQDEDSSNRKQYRVYCACADTLGMAENAVRVLYSTMGESFTRDSSIYIIDQMNQCYFAFRSTKELNQTLIELSVLGADALAPVIDTLQPYECFNGSRRYHTTPSTFLDPTHHGNALWDESDWA